MDFEFVDVIKYPVETVFPLYRDHIHEMTEYLPNVESITVENRREDGDTIHITNWWKSKIQLPAAARKLIGGDEQGWRDIAVWHNERHCVDWTFNIPALPKALDVHGTNYFLAEGKTTRLKISGTINIDYDKIPVPNIVLRGIVPAIQKMALAAVKPNMLKINRAVEQFLAAKGKK
ncbi:MAG TPA: hypothetical protein PK961_00780 [bacterium]|nr:hypothetical protein [bacterium]